MNEELEHEMMENGNTEDIAGSDQCYEFRCSSCREEFVGAPFDINGCELCAACRNQPLYSVTEIAKYISGWSMGKFGEAKGIAIATLHNALVQLCDEQDGIEACRQRDKSRHNAGSDAPGEIEPKLK